MSESATLVLAYILGVCTAVTVACWASGSAWPLLGLVFLTAVSVERGK